MLLDHKPYSFILKHSKRCIFFFFFYSVFPLFLILSKVQTEDIIVYPIRGTFSNQLERLTKHQRIRAIINLTKDTLISFLYVFLVFLTTKRPVTVTTMLPEGPLGWASQEVIWWATFWKGRLYINVFLTYTHTHTSRWIQRENLRLTFRQSRSFPALVDLQK